MRTRVFAVAAVAASITALCVLALTGCSYTRAEPAGPSEAVIAANVQARLDRQWALSGLEGIVVRPETTTERIVTANEWGDEMTRCMNAGGIESWGYNKGSGLFVAGTTPTASEQLAFYWCFARYPTIDLLSPEQLDYIYDYYAHWLTPCIEANGYNVMNAPSRKAFVHATPVLSRWNPYVTLANYPVTVQASVRLHRACPPTLPGIEGWSER